MLAAAIGNARRIQLKPGFVLPCSIWAATVGEPGTLKSPAIKLVLAPVWDLQQHAFNVFRERKQPGVGHGPAAAQAEERDPARFVVCDTTIAALAPLLAHNPRGLLAAPEELDGWFAALAARRRNPALSHWLQLFDGGDLMLDRRTGKEPTIHIPMPSVSVAGTIQPGTLRRALGRRERESGLASRFLFTMPPRVARVWSNACVPPEAVAQYALVLERLRALEVMVLGGRPEPMLLRLDNQAMTAWVRYYDELNDELTTLSGDLAAAWAKLEGYAARLALVIHLTRWAEEDASLQCAETIDRTSMAAGIALARWFGQEGRRVYAMIQGEIVDLPEGTILAWIHNRGGEVSARDLTHHLRQFRNKPGLAQAVLNDLVSDGRGEWVYPPPGAQGGRPRVQFRLSATGPSKLP